MGNSLQVLRYRMSAAPVKPVVFILGSTGTGKSDLAIALAKRFAGEVINADAMQLYKGLDIVTNKVTEEEQDGVTHHMMNILDPDSLSYTIHDYKRQTTQIIQDLIHSDRLPIVVGGTNYYMDSLLWDSLIPNPESKSAASTSCRFEPEGEEQNENTLSFMTGSSNSTDVSEDMIKSHSKEQLMDIVKSLDVNYMRVHVDKVDSSKLHSLLMAVDRETALTIHPNTARKIVRALEVLKHHGTSQQTFLTAMNKKSGDQTFGANLAYDNAVVLWLLADQTVLDERLDSRVDKMMARGLISELGDFHLQHNKRLLTNSEATHTHGDYTRGVFQCIGFKEFHDYLLMSREERDDKKGQKSLEKGIEGMRAATRRYARYQNKWVRTQLFEKRNPEYVPPVYSFDSTDKQNYNKNVVQPAIRLLDEIMRGETPSKPQHTMPIKPAIDNRVVHQTCDICMVTCVREVEWLSHIKSRRHQKRVASHKRNQTKTYKELSHTLLTHEHNLRRGLNGCTTEEASNLGQNEEIVVLGDNNQVENTDTSEIELTHVRLS